MDSEKKEDWNLWEDLPPEVEDELIERYAQKMVERDLSGVFLFAIEALGPASTLVAEVSTGFLGPFLELGGLEKFPAFFRNKASVQRLKDRVEELKEERDKANKK